MLIPFRSVQHHAGIKLGTWSRSVPHCALPSHYAQPRALHKGCTSFCQWRCHQDLKKTRYILYENSEKKKSGWLTPAQLPSWHLLPSSSFLNVLLNDWQISPAQLRPHRTLDTWSPCESLPHELQRRTELGRHSSSRVDSEEQCPLACESAWCQNEVQSITFSRFTPPRCDLGSSVWRSQWLTWMCPRRTRDRRIGPFVAHHHLASPLWPRQHDDGCARRTHSKVTLYKYMFV